MGFILQHNFHLSTTPAVWQCNGYVSKYWQFGISVSFADYRVHVLWHHAKQVGTADLSTWLHEEPPGLPPRPPCTSVALLQLHVHACWVRPSTYHVLISAELVQLPTGWLLQMLHSSRFIVCHHLSLALFLCSVLSLEQLGFNALLQLMIGVPLEMVHGILRISLLYMAGVVAGECLLKY